MNLIEKYGVDAQGLVQRYGGIEKCREIVEKAPEGAECYSWRLGDSGVRDNTVYLDDLRAAIADHDRTDNVTDIRNHISPNTRVSEAHVNEAYKLNRLGWAMKAGDRVKVDFVSESATIYSGKRFTGYGLLDRVEDGRVFGRLDDGTPFMCLCADVEVIPLVDRTEEFEAFFTAQPFFKNLRFIHGDKLFDFDKGIGYRNLTVQVGYVCFCKGDGEFVLND